MSAVTPFDVDDADPDPFCQFDAWFEQARGTMRDLDAVALATADEHGRPSCRMVLLRHRASGTYGFYTNYESRKGTDLAVNPHAAILWFNEAHGRQVRIEGVVAPMSAERSNAYFAARPRAHQIGALASNQSRPLASRAQLEDRVSELTAQLDGRDVARPSTWGGYEMTPSSFEFWQMREDRLHDRVRYELTPGTWERRRLSP